VIIVGAEIGGKGKRGTETYKREHGNMPWVTVNEERGTMGGYGFSNGF